MESKYKIGDKVWYAQRRTVEKWVECPHCFGQCALTVILGNKSEVSIECECCRRGYEGSLGKILTWEHIADAKEVVIDRVEIRADGVEYGFYGNYIAEESCLFDNEGDANKRAQELAEEYHKEEYRRFQAKEKSDRNWAWHVHYHRERIKSAEKELAYHTAKLNVAKVKVKEP